MDAAVTGSSNSLTLRPTRKALDSPQHYTAAWLTALPLERAAAQVMLDEIHDRPRGFSKSESDDNQYTWGRVSGHNVVIASLPAGEYGTNTTATTAQALRASLPHIRIGLLVGIGAGVPGKGIELGDVVVSQPDRTSGGVVQYDLCKAKNEWERKGFLNSPPRALRSALSSLQAQHEYEDPRIDEFMQVIRDNPKMRISYAFPGATARLSRLHYGTVASGNVLIKHAAKRDQLIEFLKDVNPLCFEMEAAGLMNSFPCLVIRGICDFADEHKSDLWQRYAAASAAAFAKELLTYVDVAEVEQVHLPHSSDLRLLTTSGATFDAYDGGECCLEGTRVELLRSIHDWSQTGKKIFWLCGKAGTGKSTVARTAAHNLGLNLGASFFFKRGEGDRGRAVHFFPTIAQQLADRFPSVRAQVTSALQSDSSLCEKSLQYQFGKLMKPLSLPQGLVIVIDALDECEVGAQAALIELLSQVSIRILITSRPEIPIELGFRKIDGSIHHDVLLEDVRDIRADLELFLRSRLSKIREDAAEISYRSLSSDWPGQRLHDLVELADPLFIVAATVCRFISGRRPEQRLQAILADPTLTGIDSFYLQILRSAEDLDTEILGAVITVYDALDINALSNLLAVEPDKIWNGLVDLRSVLVISRSSPLRVMHQSFRDHLLSAKAQDFHIDMQLMHAKLAACCMQRFGRSNEMPGQYKPDARRVKVDYAIRPDLQYACYYWIDHVLNSGMLPAHEARVYSFLKANLLHWLEIMSWLDRLGEVVLSLRRLLSVVNTPELVDLLQDALRFVAHNRHLLTTYPMQLYSSALLFAPRCSTMRSMFSHNSVCTSAGESAAEWPNAMSFQTGRGTTHALAFSSGSKMLATISKDTVHIWDLLSGDPKQTLRHAVPVDAVVFMDDDNLLVSFAGSAIRVWDILLGTTQQLLNLPSQSAAVAVALSHDGKTMALSNRNAELLLCRDNSILLLSERPSSAHRYPYGWNSMHAVRFSNSDQMLAYGGDGGIIQIWRYYDDILPYYEIDLVQEEASLMERRSTQWRTIDFTSNDGLIAAAAGCKVLIWSTLTWERCHTISVRDASPLSIRFSSEHDDSLVGIFDDGHVRRYDPNSGHRLRTNVLWKESVAFATMSPDGESAAFIPGGSDFAYVLPVAQEDRDTDKSAPLAHIPVDLIALSPDRTLIAIARGVKVYLWSTLTASLQHVLECGRVSDLAFFSDGIVFAASDSVVLHILDLSTGAIEDFETTLNARLHACSPDSQWIAITDGDGLVTEPMILKWRFGIWRAYDCTGALAFCPSKAIAAVVRTDDQVGIWDLETGESTVRLRHSVVHPQAAAWSSDGDVLTVIGSSIILGMSAVSGEIIWRIDPQSEPGLGTIATITASGLYVMFRDRKSSLADLRNASNGSLGPKTATGLRWCDQYASFHSSWIEWSSGREDTQSTFSCANGWMQADSENVLLLPPGHSMETCLTFAQTAVMFCESGGLFVLKLNRRDGV